MEICATFYKTFQLIEYKLPPGIEKMADDKVFNDLLLACRLGDIESVDKLLSTGVNVGIDSISFIGSIIC